MRNNIFSCLRNSRVRRYIAAFLAINLLAEIVSPTVAMALTSGPSSPEFSSFEPVATTDMVNEYTGDFTYNIPVLHLPGSDGGEYSLSLSYHSGGSSQEDASWVGYGWTLNPGAVNRNKRGYADEFKGVRVRQYNKNKPNFTETSKFDFNMEYNSRDKKKQEKQKNLEAAADLLKKAQQFLGDVSLPIAAVDQALADNASEDSGPADISLSFTHSIRYNNYSGFSIANGLGIGLFGAANVCMNRSGGQNTFGFSVNPVGALRLLAPEQYKQLRSLSNKTLRSKMMQDGMNIEAKTNSKVKNIAAGVAAYAKRLGKASPGAAVGAFLKMANSWYSFRSYNAPSVPYSVSKTRSFSWNYSASVEFNPSGPFGFQMGVAGSMNMTATEGEQDRYAYGYMYASEHNADSEEDVLHDYQLEKESTFSRHDNNLGVPFNNADLFSVTGANVLGGFRFRHQDIGVYFPNQMENKMKIRQLGLELGIGATMQFGLDVGIGKQTTKVNGKWKKVSAPGDALPGFSTSLPKLYFENDNGGEIDYNSSSGSDEIPYARVDNLGGSGGDKRLLLDGTNYFSMDNTKATTSSSIYYDYYEHPTDDTKNYITGMHITSQEGTKSHYTLPVYTREEAALSIGLDENSDGSMLATSSFHYDSPLNNRTVTGYKTEEQYANTFLLTSNTSYNYVDADNIYGPSEGDFGGWTRFDYKQIYGGAVGNWYRYRSPYNGLFYNGGRMVDKHDQVGSMISGEKEVYYLKCIENKSHIAFFVTNMTSASTFTTDFPAAQYPSLYVNGQPASALLSQLNGSGLPRKDGLDAKHIAAGMDVAAEGLSERGVNAPHKLEKIVLFSKTDLSKPINTTFFEYDYTICRKVANNAWNAATPGNETGKLSLRRVWTEANGVLRAQIAPYQFHYNYYNKYEQSIVAKYPWAAAYNASGALQQNPDYQPEQLDAWGSFRKNGIYRIKNEKFFVDQRAADADFDPAAWQLKRIQLPSGGEIHVHYEQKDYNTVQDRRALVMVSLKDDDKKNNSYYTKDAGNKNNAEYRINLDDIRVDPVNIDEYVKVLKDYFLGYRNKLYFKALYSFRKDKKPELNNGDDFSQYITGYTAVNDVVRSGNDIILKLGDTREGKGDPTLPRYVCYQELLTNGGKNLGPNASDYKDDDFTTQVYDSNPVQEDDVKKITRKRIRTAVLGMFADWVSFKVKNTFKANACTKLDYENSYFRLPTFHAKKGGGIRVRRILAYDKGIAAEAGADARLTGLEYIYSKPRTGSSGISDGYTDKTVVYESQSSGVALNEPAELREENAMVTYLERKKQKWINKILNGRDTKQFEGFMGESILPPAQVVHSHVIVKNIHSNYDAVSGRSSSTGYTVNEYFTPRDFPFSAEWTQLKKENNTFKRKGLHLPLGVFNMDVDRAWVTQGYLFKTNDMAGKMKCSTVYPYSSNTQPEDYASGDNFTSRTTYTYSKPGEDINTLVYNPGTKVMTRTTLKAGTEEDYSMYSSDVQEKSVDFSIELDLNITFLLVNVYPGFPAVSFSCSRNQIAQFLTSKVVNQSSFLLSVTTESDGMRQVNENLCFDRYTGNPVLTRTYDVFMSKNNQIRTTNDGTSMHNGHLYSLTIPASWIYKEMGPASVYPSIPYVQNRLSEYAGNIVTYGSNAMYNKVMTTATWSPVSDPLSNVVSATAVTFTNNWFNAVSVTEYPNLAFAGTSSPSVTAALPVANAFWYPLRTYYYRDVVKNANAAGGRIYEGGVTTQPFKFFDWTAAASNTAAVPAEWYSDSYVTRYSPDGYPTEQEDVLAIRSSALYGYNNLLPIAVAQNATRSEIVFKDFEQGISNSSAVTNLTAHSGRHSMQYAGNSTFEFASDYPLSLQKGLALKVWMKSRISTPGPNYGLKNPNPLLKADIGGNLFDFRQIAQTGDWTLYACDISNFNGLSGQQDIKLSYTPTAGEEVYFDDFRAQPLNASVNCSSYYPDNRLAMQFDDQHFGILYEYDGRGQLVRKSIETERGKKTLQEKQYNTPLRNKN